MANNNFYLNSDPLLYGNSAYQRTEEDMKRQLNDAMLQYKALQQQQAYQKDYVGELDTVSKGMSEGVKDNLIKNKEYQRLNNDLQTLIQSEILLTIKNRLNTNPNVIKNIERQIELIKEANSEVEDEQRKNLSELNDYVKNYSNITFDEYKKIKGKKQSTSNESTRTENKN